MRIALLLFLAAPSLLAAPARPPASPLPSWFDVAPVPAAPPSSSARPVDWLLVDRQTRVAAGGVQRVYRKVERINTPEGVQNSSEVRVTYDPSYERVLFHRVRLVRQGVARDALAKSDFRTLNREAGLEESLLDGRLSAVLILHDVRPGDVLDLAWSVRGDPPQLAGHFNDLVYLSADGPVTRLRQRLLWPSARPLRVRPRGGAPEPRVRDRGGEREYLWDGPSAPVQMDRDVPDWFDPWPAVEFTDFADWGEVARWASPLFAADPAAVASIVAPWRGLPEEERAARALAFAREQVRYFGMEMGVHAHKPHPPALVLQRRFGDCKDKTILLVSLLEALGIKASPALANTRERRGLDDRLPSAYAFDHAIVLARVGGVDHWLDATITSQRGPLAALSSPDYERALVLDPATTQLSKLPDPDASNPLETVEETIRARSRSGMAEVAVVSTFSGMEADDRRGRLPARSAEMLGKDYLDFYRRFEPRIEQARVPVLRDDPDRDRFAVEESYRIPDFWSEGEHEVVLDGGFRLRRPRDGSARTMPLAIPFPVHVLHRTRIEVPPDREPDLAVGSRDFSAAGLRATVRSSVVREKDGPVVLLSAELRTTAAEVPAAEVAAYADALEKMHDALHVRLGLRAPPARSAVGTGNDAPGYLVLVFAAALVGLMWSWPRAIKRIAAARKRRFLRSTVPGRGESAANPLTLSTPEELQRHARARRCPCGRSLSGAALQPAGMALVGGHTVHVVKLPCSCGHASFVYFEERR